MDQNTPDTSTSMIAVFRARAARLRTLAYGVLGVIFLLLVGGATAFILAPQITLSDFGKDLDVDNKLADVELEMTKLRETMAIEKSAKEAEWTQALTAAYKVHDLLGANFGMPVVLTKEGKEPDGIAPDILIKDYNVFDIPKVTKAFDELPSNKATIRIHIEHPPGVREAIYDIPRTNIAAAQSAWTAAIVQKPSPDPRDLEPPSAERYELLLTARGVLQKRKTEQSLASILGAKTTAKANSTKPNATPSPLTSFSDISIAQLIQTNVTRFGTIILITLLVSILTPLYRYNVRLATYYDARADVIELFAGKLRSVGFSNLITSLTPTFQPLIFLKARPLLLTSLSRSYRSLKARRSQRTEVNELFSAFLVGQKVAKATRMRSNPSVNRTRNSTLCLPSRSNYVERWAA